MKPATKRTLPRDFRLATGAKARKRRYATRPSRFWLDVGKAISLELTAGKYGFNVADAGGDGAP